MSWYHDLLRYFQVRKASRRAKMIPMLKAPRQFFRLSAEQKWFVLRALIILPTTYAALELFGLQPLLGFIRRFAKVDGSIRDCPTAQLRTYTRLFTAVARSCPFPMKCLGRSVALCWLLRGLGVDATVHIGVRKGEEGLDAHAWVQRGDFVINDAEDVAERYIRIVPEYPRVNAATQA